MTNIQYTRVQDVPEITNITDSVTVTTGSTANALVETLGNEPIWLTWAAQHTDAGRITKIPSKIQGGKQKMIDATDPKALATYHEVVGEVPAMKTVGYSGLGGVGISTRHRQDIECVDFDHCVKDGTITNTEIAEFVTTANTYAEYSPSGTGIRVIFLVEGGKPEKGFKSKVRDANQTDIEMQTNCTYYTITENAINNIPPCSVTKSELEALYRKISLVKPSKKDVPVEPSKIKHADPTNLTDAELLEKAYQSKGGDKLKALYVDGDTTPYDGDDSSADMALCMRLAFWTGRNAERIDRMFRASALMRPKWDQQRGACTYGQLSVKRAVEHCRDTYSASAEVVDYTKLIMSKPDKQGKASPLPIYENIRRIILTDRKFTDRLRYNEFSFTPQLRDLRTNKWNTLPDSLIFEVWSHVSATYGWTRRIAKGVVQDALLAACHHYPVNPPKEYILSLSWDGVPRLDTWTQSAFGAPDEAVYREMGANWIKGMVKRIIEPGCQFDNVLVLEGPQGIGKTSALRILGNGWHVELTLDVDSKDFIMTLANNIIVEFSEGDIVNRTDMKRLKGIVTKREDQVRLPYGRSLSTIPRGCVFAMTTNDTQYLKDETGNRRWWPIQIKQAIDLDWLRTNRDQLYAEAYARLRILGEPTYVFTDEKKLKELQDQRRTSNEYEETLIDWYLGQEPRKIFSDGISLREAHEVLFADTCGSEVKKEMTQLHQAQVAGMLRGALHLHPEQIKIDGQNVRRWFPTDATYEKFDLPKYDEDGKKKDTRRF